MKSNIRITFEKCKNEKRPALLTYTVAGDNTKKKSLEILNAIAPFVEFHITPL
jgi:tryptophan synthase alpha chain